MKFRLIYPAFLISTLAVLPSCDDNNTPEAKEQPGQQAPAEPAQEPAKPETPEPDADTIGQAIPPLLEEYPFLNIDCTTIEQTPSEDGSVSVTVRLALSLKENLMEAQQAPAAFNEERKGINDAANKAMQPDSLYLLQIGAPTGIITDDDRAAKPLPEDLQNKANALKELSDSLVYTVKAAEGTTYETTATMKATQEDGKWLLREAVLEQSPLAGLASAIRQSTLPEGAQLLTDDFQSTRKEELKRGIAEFNEAAHAYILTREETARALYTERQAVADEANKKAEEAAAAATAEKEAWEAVCSGFVASGKNFAGEWRRGNRFGEITLHIEKAERFDGSIQFIGSLYDTKLPEASLEIAGRCALTPSEDGTAHLDVTIYDGQYDPDQPTAEVYDAQDGMLSLSLTKEGKLSGIMGCTAWGNESDKNFNVSLTPKAAGKSSKRR